MDCLVSKYLLFTKLSSTSWWNAQLSYALPEVKWHLDNLIFRRNSRLVLDLFNLAVRVYLSLLCLLGREAFLILFLSFFTNLMAY